MTAHRIIAEAAAAGLQLTVQGGNLLIRGVGPRPAGLIHSICQQKVDIISVLQGRIPPLRETSERSEERRGSVTALPPVDLPLVDVLQPLTQEEQARIIGKVMEQGKPAIGWCLTRANAYYEKFPKSSFQEQDVAAAWDLLSWQGIDPNQLAHP